MREGIAYLSFTRRGAELSNCLCAALGGEMACTRDDPTLTLDGWTAARFPVKRALVYIGAAGIAVRAIAPHLRGKREDPAVVVLDEYGRFVISLLSGHWGGANDLARLIASITGGTAVITTATDLNGVFAVDEWAKRHNCAVIHPEAVKTVSGRLLAGQTVRLISAFPIAGTPPDGLEFIETDTGADRTEADTGASETGADTDIIDADIWIDSFRHSSLCLIPKALTLGIGCRRGVAPETLERRFAAFCKKFRLCPQAFRSAATIDLKAEEPGLLFFCAAHGWPLNVFSAEELRRVSGTFTASEFVERQTGVDNICERAAVLNNQGRLLVRKYAGEGVTFAAALSPVPLDWNWK